MLDAVFFPATQTLTSNPGIFIHPFQWYQNTPFLILSWFLDIKRLSVLTLQLTCPAFPCGNYFIIYNVKLTLVAVTVLILSLVIYFPRGSNQVFHVELPTFNWCTRVIIHFLLYLFKWQKMELEIERTVLIILIEQILQRTLCISYILY